MKIKNSVPLFLTALLAGIFACGTPLRAQVTRPDEKICRVYTDTVFPDLPTRGETPATGEAPVDPFADAPSVKPAAAAGVRCPKFPWVIPALGDQYPTDARRVFEDLGVTFAEGDVVLFHPRNTRARLFVRAGREAHELVDTILQQVVGVYTVKTVRCTWLLTEKSVEGKSRTLLERTLLCRAGQTVKFQRHSAERLVEEVECETTVGEDGISVDLNNAVQLHLKNLDISVVNQTLLRSEDPTGVALYTGPGTRRGSTAELRVTAEVMRGIPSPEKSDDSPEALAVMAAKIDRQLQTLEKNGQEKEKLSGLYYMPPWFGNAVTGEKRWRETGLVKLKAHHLMDAREALHHEKVELDKDDTAWYAPESRLLYIRAGAAGRARVAEMAERIQLSRLNQVEVQFASTAERMGKVRDLPLRSLLVKAGQKSKAESKTRRGAPENIEIECIVDESSSEADLNFSLTNHPMGRETWTLNMETLAATDGTRPVPLVTGRAADAGGILQTLTLTAHPAGDQWQQLVADPARKAAAIKEIETALAPPAGQK